MKSYKITITKSNMKGKKYTSWIYDLNGKLLKKVNFGAKGYSDYTIHKDIDRMKRYNKRHQKNENWRISGILTAGWWAKWFLWNKDTKLKSISDIMKRFPRIKKIIYNS